MSRTSTVALAVWLFTAGCRSVAPPPTPLSLDDPRPARFLAGLVARGESLNSLRCLARLSVDGPRGSVRAKQVLVARRPAQLRVEILGLLNQALAVLVTDGVNYDYFEARERIRDRGPVRPDLLFQIAGIPLVPEDAVAVLIGAPDASAPWVPIAASEFHDGRIQVGVAGENGVLREIFEFDGEGGLLAWQRHLPDGSLIWQARYGDLRQVGDRVFAHAVDAKFPTLQVQVKVEFDRVELNPPLTDEIFSLQLPAGIVTRPREGGGLGEVVR